MHVLQSYIISLVLLIFRKIGKFLPESNPKYILVSECINCLSGYANDERLFHREFVGADLSNCASQVIFIDDPCLEPNN